MEGRNDSGISPSGIFAEIPQEKLLEIAGTVEEKVVPANTIIVRPHIGHFNGRRLDVKGRKRNALVSCFLENGMIHATVEGNPIELLLHHLANLRDAVLLILLDIVVFSKEGIVFQKVLTLDLNIALLGQQLAGFDKALMNGFKEAGSSRSHAKLPNWPLVSRFIQGDFAGSADLGDGLECKE